MPIELKVSTLSHNIHCDQWSVTSRKTFSLNMKLFLILFVLLFVDEHFVSVFNVFLVHYTSSFNRFSVKIRYLEMIQQRKAPLRNNYR